MKDRRHHKNCGAARTEGAVCSCEAGSLRGEPLTFNIEADRHYLMGEPLHCGEAVDIRLADGTWLSGRFEIERGRDGAIYPRFFWGVRLLGDSPSTWWDAWIPIPEYAELRWPVESRAPGVRRLG